MSEQEYCIKHDYFFHGDPDDCPLCEVDDLKEEITRLRARLAEEEKGHEKAITERDHWEDKATELANDTGEALGFDVGEHSNMNCPVQNAIDGVAEMRSQIDDWHKLAEVEGQEAVATLTVNETTMSASYHLDPLSVLPIGEHSLYTHPAPAKVPDIFTTSDATEYLFRNQTKVTSDEVRCIVEGWNACREAMLEAQGGE